MLFKSVSEKENKVFFLIFFQSLNNICPNSSKMLQKSKTINQTNLMIYKQKYLLLANTNQKHCNNNKT